MGTTTRDTDAAQFMPFAALTGYHELAHEQERMREPRHAVDEERAADISRMLLRLRRGDAVRVTHYGRDAYVTTCGRVRQVDEAYHALELVATPGRDGAGTSTARIPFDDIWELAWGQEG